MAEKLKPCPFCGGEPREERYEPHKHSVSFLPDYPGSWSIECDACEFRLFRHESRDAVVAAWNKRAQHAGEARERVAWGKYRYDMPQPAAVPFGWVSPTQGNYFARNKTIANRIGGLMPVYAAPQPAALPEGWEWLDVIREKIQHCRNCCEDFEADGCDMSREWFDALTTIGLLRRVQRSPAIWEMTEAAEAMLAAAPQPRE